MSALKDTDFDIDVDEFEMSELYFIKLAASNVGDMNAIQTTMDRILLQANKNRARNFYRFLKVCVAQDYLNFGSPAVHYIFNNLASILFVRGVYRNEEDDELKILTHLFLKDAIQQTFFESLKKYIHDNDPKQYNYSLYILRYIILRALNVLTGKERGVAIQKKCLVRVIELGFDASKSRLHTKAKTVYSNEEDQILSLKIFTGAIEIENKYVCNDQIYKSNSQNRVEIIVQIFEEMLLNKQRQTPTFVNQIFGLIKQLYKKQTARVQEVLSFEDSLRSLFTHSEDFGLRCPNINEFWNVYISKTNNHTAIWGSVNSIHLAILFTKVLDQYSHNICQINQKLAIVDNLIAINNIGTKMHELTEVLNSGVSSNPQEHGKNSMFVLAIQSLYSPLFEIKGNRVGAFNKLMATMKIFSQVYLKTHEILQNENFLPIMNMIPAIKILVIKSKQILLQQDYIQILIPFLFTLLSIPQCQDSFEKLINFILNQFSDLLSLQAKGQDSRKLSSLIFWCLQFLVRTKPVHISRSLKCIESMIKLETNRITWANAPFYMKILIGMIHEIKNEGSQNLFNLMSSIIKSHKIDNKEATKCLQLTYETIQKSQKYYYVGILFDYGETYSNIFSIYDFLKSHQDKILSFSSNYQMLEQIFRSLSFSIMLQIISQDIEISLEVTQRIKSTYHDVKTRSSFYIQICGLIQKQLIAFKKQANIFETSDNIQECNKGQQIMRIVCDQLLNILLDMIYSLNETPEETQIEKIKASSVAAEIIFNITCFFLQRLDLRGFTPGFNAIIKKIRKTILHLKIRSAAEFEQGLKYMYTSKMIFETRQYNWKNQLPKVFSKEDYLQMNEILKLKVKSRSLSDSSDRSCLENMLAYTSCEKYIRINKAGYALEK